MHGSRTGSRPRPLWVMLFFVVALSASGDIRPGVGAAECPPRQPRADSPSLPGAPSGALAALPLQRPSDCFNAPTAYIGRTLQVNPGVGRPVRSIPVVHEHGNVRVSYGRVADGVGAGELTDYLAAEAKESRGGPMKPFRLTLTVRVVEGATPEMIDQTVRAVQLINAALRPEWRLGFDESPVPRQFADSLGVVRCERLICDTVKIPAGDIIVQFAPAEVWSKKEVGEGEPRPSGWAEYNWSVRSLGSRTLSNWAGRIWVDPARATGPERLLRQAKSWKGGCHELKPFVAIQRVRHPPGKGAASQPEASLAWRAATPVVKRRQRVTKRRRKPRNR